MRKIIANIFAGASLNYLLAAVTACAICAAMPSFAADWTDAGGNEYTALKYLKANGSTTTGGPYIITDFKPVGNSTVKLQFKPTTVSGNECLFCSRQKVSNKVSNSMSGFRIGTKIRLDRRHTTRYPTCETTTLEANKVYSLSADFTGSDTATTGAATINGVDQTLSGILGSQAYTPASVLTLFASHEDASISASSADSKFDNKGSYYLYYFQLYSPTDGSLTHNLMPAQNSSGVAGLYDTVTRTFYGPTGPSGYTTFTTEAYTGRTGKKWTGAGTDNKMSTGDNWEGGVAPTAGDDIDFTIAVPFAEIDADIDAVFGKVWLGAGDLPAFTGSLTATGINDIEKMQDYDTATAGFTFTLEAPAGQDFTWNGGAAANWWATDAWIYDNAASSWLDNNNAIFNTANAMVTLDANVTAASVAFNANTTIATNGTDAATLAVSSVAVAPGVSAAIGTRISGALTLAEGTLALTDTASLDWSALTFGSDAAKPVRIDFGPTATLSPVPATWSIGNAANVTSTVVKAGGDWTFSGDVRVGSGAGAVASFYHNGGTISAARLIVGDDNTSHAGTGYCEISDSTVTCSGIFYVGLYSGGDLVVTNGGRFVSTTASNSSFVGYDYPGTLTVENGGSVSVAYRLWLGYYTGAGTLTVKDGGSINVADNLYLGRNSDGTLTVENGGSVSVNKSIIMCENSTDATGVLNISGDVSAQNAWRNKAGSATVNFDGGTFRKSSGNGNFFPPTGNNTAIDVTVSANGGTLDNNSLSVALPCTITGEGGMTLSGSGTTTVSADQEYLGTTTVSNETTLSVSGVTFAGPVVFEAGSALDIASYTAGVVPMTATVLSFPAEGTVPLTFNGGAFPVGVYAICSASGLTAADGAKFAPSTGALGYSWSLVDSALVLAVGDVDPNAWTGLGGDGRMSNGANWAGGSVPAADADIDLSGISADTTLIADAERTFGAVTMGTSVITFTNDFAATSFSDTSKVAVGADSTVTLNGDLVFATSTRGYICHSIAEGGTFAVTGDIIGTPDHSEYIAACVTTSIEGTISARGLVNNCKGDDRFGLARGSTGSHVQWLIGDHGISGTKRYAVGNQNNVVVTITAAADFTISTGIIQYRNLTLDTAGYEITVGTNTLVKSGGFVGGSANGLTTITGAGKVIVNYNVNDLSNRYDSRTNAFTVATGATLAFNPGGNIGFGALTVQDGGTLELPSGTTTFGNLIVEEDAILGFNFTDRRIAPVLVLYDGAVVDAQDTFTVKVSGTAWPMGGEKQLTTCGGFDGIPLTLSAVGDAARWAKQENLSVNAAGNIVLDVKPMGTIILFK